MTRALGKNSAYAVKPLSEQIKTTFPHSLLIVNKLTVDEIN